MMDKDLDITQLIELVRRAVPGTNLAASPRSYLPPGGATVGFLPTQLGQYNNSTKRVTLADDISDRAKAITAAHEGAHVRQFEDSPERSKSILPSSWDRPASRKSLAEHESENVYLDDVHKLLASVSSGKREDPAVRTAITGQKGMAEVEAQLKALESALPAGQTLIQYLDAELASARTTELSQLLRIMLEKVRFPEPSSADALTR